MLTLSPFTSKILVVILLTVCQTTHTILAGEFGIGSATSNNTLIDNFL